MKKIFCFIILLIWAVNNTTAQTWVIAQQYKDEWGDPSGGKLIEQKVEGSLGAMENKILVRISRVVPSADHFSILTYDLNGRPYDYMDINPVRIENGPPARVLKKNPFMDPTTYPGAKIIENKYLLRYKIGDRESSFYITRTSGLRNRLFFEVDFSKLNAILLSTSTPIKCIIAEEVDNSGGGTRSNLFSFTLYPANYKQLIR